MKRLHGRYALVTGGSSGIGAACARALAGEGAAVVAAARRFGAGAAAAQPTFGGVAEVHLDVTDEREVEARIAAMPELDVLVCSAGTGTFGPIADASAAALREMLDVHVVGTLVCAREALKRMRPRRRGHIVVIGSHAAHGAFTDCGGYTAAKAGQLGLARVLAAEARPDDIRVTAVLAGATDTPMDDRPGFDRGKMMQPDDVAGFVVELVARPNIAVGEVVVMPPAGVL